MPDDFAGLLTDQDGVTQAATIRFLRPGRSTLHARFILSTEVLDSIRAELRDAPRTDRVFRVERVDPGGVVHAEVEKTIHIRRRAGAG